MRRKWHGTKTGKFENESEFLLLMLCERKHALNCLVLLFSGSMNIRAFYEEDQSEWNKSTLTWDPKGHDPPHVNSMKRAEVTDKDGKY